MLVVGDREIPLGAIDAATRCDLGLVDDIARFCLAALRLGWAIRLRDVDTDLGELVGLAGLADRLGIDRPRPEP